MDEEESVDIEFVEEEEGESSDYDYDVSLHEGAIFIPNATNFVDKYKVVVVWVPPGGEPQFLTEDNGMRAMSDLLKPVRNLNVVK